MEPDEIRRIITSIEQKAAAQRAAEQPQMVLEQSQSGLILPMRTPWPLARDAAESSTEPPDPADQAESAD